MQSKKKVNQIVTKRKQIYQSNTRKFVNRNQQCIIYFDCKRGYEEAKTGLEKKKDEFDQLNLILEEKDEKEKLKKEKDLQNKKKEKEARENLAKQELEKIQKKRAILYIQTEKANAQQVV